MNKQEIIAAISEQLDKENGYIAIDDDNDVYLFDGDTEEQEGECFRIEALSKDKGQVFVEMDYDLNDKWLLNDLSEYELNIIYDAFFGDDDEWDDDED